MTEMLTFLACCLCLLAGLIIATHPVTQPVRDNPDTIAGLYGLAFAVSVAMLGWLMFGDT